MRIGFGCDLHVLKPGKPLILGGVQIPSPLGPEAHSDGDVLVHALIDALLGAMAEGDIGSHFPPSDPAYRGISSMILLKKVLEIVKNRGYAVGNIDTTIVLENPKLKDHKKTIQTVLASELNLTADRVSVKAKTREQVDAVGEGRAVEAFAVVLLFPL